jgi:hypothetical protein
MWQNEVASIGMSEFEQDLFFAAMPSVQESMVGFSLPPTPAPPGADEDADATPAENNAGDGGVDMAAMVSSLPMAQQMTIGGMSPDQQAQFFAASASVQQSMVGFSMPPTPAPATPAPATPAPTPPVDSTAQMMALVAALPPAQQAVIAGMSSTQQAQFFAAPASVQESTVGFSLPFAPPAPANADLRFRRSLRAQFVTNKNSPVHKQHRKLMRDVRKLMTATGAADVANAHMEMLIASLPPEAQMIMAGMSTEQQQQFMNVPASVQQTMAGFSLPPTPAPATPAPTPESEVTREFSDHGKFKIDEMSAVVAEEHGVQHGLGDQLATREELISKLPRTAQVMLSGCFANNESLAEGRYFTLEGATKNGEDMGISCPAGKYSDGNAQTTSCKSCPKGRYQVSDGATGCHQCPYGKYSNHTDAISCEFCPYGQMISRFKPYCFEPNTKLNEAGKVVLNDPGPAPPGPPFGLPADVIGSLSGLPNVAQLFGMMEDFKGACAVCYSYPCGKVEEVVMQIGIPPPAVAFSKGTVADTIGACLMCGTDPDDGDACGFADPIKQARRWPVCDPLCGFQKCYKLRDDIKDHLREVYGLPPLFNEFLSNQIVTPLCWGCDDTNECRMEYEIHLAEQEEKADGLTPLDQNPLDNTLMENDQAIIDAIAIEREPQFDEIAVMIDLSPQQQGSLGLLSTPEQENFFLDTPEEQEKHFGFSIPPTPIPENGASTLRLSSYAGMELDLTFSQEPTKAPSATPSTLGAPTPLSAAPTEMPSDYATQLLSTLEQSTLDKLPEEERVQFEEAAPMAEELALGFSLPPSPAPENTTCYVTVADDSQIQANSSTKSIRVAQTFYDKLNDGQSMAWTSRERNEVVYTAATDPPNSALISTLVDGASYYAIKSAEPQDVRIFLCENVDCATSVEEAKTDEMKREIAGVMPVNSATSGSGVNHELTLITRGTAPPPHCYDKRLDYDETGVDCGGLCPGCELGGLCVTGMDCQSGVCSEGSHCIHLEDEDIFESVPPHCNDGRLDFDETGVDCGGMCTGCPEGGLCVAGGDCLSGNCTAESVCVGHPLETPAPTAHVLWDTPAPTAAPAVVWHRTAHLSVHSSYVDADAEGDGAGFERDVGDNPNDEHFGVALQDADTGGSYGSSGDAEGVDTGGSYASSGDAEGADFSIVEAASCADTAGWRNPMQKSCATYAYEGWCIGGAAVPGQEWTLGEHYGYPERHCCACGKGASSSDKEASSSGSGGATNSTLAPTPASTPDSTPGPTFSAEQVAALKLVTVDQLEGIEHEGFAAIDKATEGGGPGAQDGLRNETAGATDSTVVLAADGPLALAAGADDATGGASGDGSGFERYDTGVEVSVTMRASIEGPTGTCKRFH